MASVKEHRGLAFVRRACLGVSVLAACAIILGGAGESARADVSPFLTQFGSQGSAAGELNGASGIATDPADGDVFVVSSDFFSNNRVDEFTAWGNFVKAWGWGVRDGSESLQTCGPEATPPGACRQGNPGPGPGQMKRPNGITVDAAGDLYVYEHEQQRVQKFHPDGSFAWMVGAGVDQGPVHPGDICTAAFIAGGDVCGAGTIGTGARQFSIGPVALGVERNYIAVGPTGIVYVADHDRIQELNGVGAFQGEIKYSEIGTGFPSSGDPGALAVDPVSGDLYFAFAQETSREHSTAPNVYRIASSGSLAASPLPVEFPTALATDASGDLYAVEAHHSVPNQVAAVKEFNSSGTLLASCCTPDIIPGNQEEQRLELTALAVNGAGDLYAANTKQHVDSYIRAYGPPPLKFGPPPSVPPDIGAQYATAVSTDGATVRAEINPHFWTDTAFYVEYGTADCTLGGCSSHPLPPGGALGAGPVGSFVVSPGVFLSGLRPATTYHYRFVAASGGGGPSFGADKTFTTQPEPAEADRNCANDSMRTGLSAALPDCRAYELVSPLDKNNGDILTRNNLLAYPNALDQASEDGNKFAFSSYRAFDSPKSSPSTSQYLVSRDPEGGWTSESLNSPRDGSSFLGSEGALETEFKAFSSDLSSTWIMHDTEPVLSPEAPVGFPDIYRRDNSTGAYQALNPTPPPNRSPFDFVHGLELQGFSIDGTHAVFRANDQLTPDAPNLPYEGGSGSRNMSQLYESYGDGQLRLVSVLPNGEPSMASSSAGKANSAINANLADTRSQEVTHAISADGSRIFWTAAAGESSGGPGKLYVRVNGTETLEVSKKEDTEFQLASADGSRVLYTVSGNLSEAVLEEEGGALTVHSHLIAHEVVRQVLGASDDASKFYFVSQSEMGGAPPGSSGKPNLYFYDGESSRFIATLGVLEAGGTETGIFSPISYVPVVHTAEVSPTGEQMVFTSTEPLTGYENIDAKTGQRDAEVFLYDAAADEGAGQLSCVSCNPTGVRPSGRIVTVPGTGGAVPMAAFISPFQNQLYQPRYLVDDGRRLFFTSFESLALTDTNGKADVYEWERPGVDSCTQQSPTFDEANDGCVSLISSGQSPADSEFLEADPTGRNVFFTTDASLLSQDYGLIDVYDARVGGGFPPPPAAAKVCEGESCQGPYTPPNDPTPASSAFQGAGNVGAGPRAARCTRQRARRHGHCAKKKKKTHAKGNRRAGR